MSASATQQAKRLRDQHCLSVPVNLAPLLAADSLAVVPMPLGDGIQELLSGPLRKIAVSDSLARRDRRVVIAHALGHWHLHTGNQLRLDEIDPLLNPKQEEAADSFARALLIPPSLLASRLRKGESVEELADLLDVPLALVHEAVADLHQHHPSWTQTTSFAI